jgi:hypothetical protein
MATAMIINIGGELAGLPPSSSTKGGGGGVDVFVGDSEGVGWLVVVWGDASIIDVESFDGTVAELMGGGIDDGLIEGW